MKDIEKKVVEVIQKEEQKFNEEIKKIDVLVKDINEVCPIEKPTYALPLVDTIGKTYFNTLNCSVIL